MNAVPCITFIKRGVAKQHPERVKLEADVLKSLIQRQAEELEDLEISDADSDDQDEVEEVPLEDDKKGGTKRKKGNKDGASGSAPGTEKQGDHENTSSDNEVDSESDEDFAKKYGLDDYDDEDDKNNDAMKFDGISTFPNAKDDPYLKDEVDSEAEDLEIKPQDSIVAVAKVQGDFNTLEVYVYEENESNLYCHHDNFLSTFPLAMEWLDFDPTETQTANLLAIGSMQPDIEIWDLDVIEAMEPAFVLAGASKKKGKKKKKLATSGHSDAVLTLSWNHNQRQMLASGSADCTVGLWDLSHGAMLTSIPHEEKVQSIQWHPVECQSLLTGAFDHTVKVYDCRSPDKASKQWMLSGEVEQVKWNKHDPYYFLATSEDGNAFYIDVRAAEPVFTWKAHQSSTAGVAIDSTLPGCVLTVSSDKTMKVWDIRNEEPLMVVKKNLHMGELHCLDNCPDASLVFAVGGEREHRIVSLKKNEAVAKAWNLTIQGGEEEIDSTKAEADLTDEEDSEDDVEPKAATAKIPKKKKKTKKQKKTKQN